VDQEGYQDVDRDVDQHMDQNLDSDTHQYMDSDMHQDTDIEKSTYKIPELGENLKMKHKPVSKTEKDRIIAVDFGTTFSSIAYTLISSGMSPGTIDANRVKCIGNYPGYEPPPRSQMDFRGETSSCCKYTSFTCRWFTKMKPSAETQS
jgi:hypothetical protein